MDRRSVSDGGGQTAMETVAIVPCKNEAESIATVVNDLRAIGVGRILVCLDPQCSDATATLAAGVGALIVRSLSSGYDGPVLAGIAALVVERFDGRILFLDGGNKYEMATIGALLGAVDPKADITFGVRDTQLFWHQRLGNLMFSLVLYLRYRHWVQDTSSVRVIPMSFVRRLKYEDRQFSLPFQTVVNGLALKANLQYVNIRCTPTRTGESKVSGSPRNSAKAARQMVRSMLRRPRNL